MCGLLALTSFYFPLFLPSLFLFLFLFLINKKFMANLYNSAKEGVDTADVLSFIHKRIMLSGEFSMVSGSGSA